MRIAMVSEHASPLAAISGEDAGGQNVHVAELALALADRGHEVTVYTRRSDPWRPDTVSLGPGVRVEHVRAGPAAPVPKDDLPRHMPEFARRLRAYWRADRPTVVHAHFWMSGLASLQAAGPLDLPVLQTFHALGVVKRRHQGIADTSPVERIAVERAVARRCDLVVATSTEERRELASWGVSPDRVAVVPCGVDTERFSPDGPAAGRGSRPRILSLGRLVRRKGVETVIEALAEVPGAELVVAGGARPGRLWTEPEAVRLRMLAERLGVDDRVRFLGCVDRSDVPALLRSVDVAVNVPWYEPFGISTIEAMASGTPVVASRVGGHLDTVVPGETGLLVPPRDPERLGRAVRWLLSDDESRRAFAAASAARAQQRYSWAEVARLTEECFLRVVGGEEVSLPEPRRESEESVATAPRRGED
ncbi:glycosyltransferase [Nocardiopsis algeriensis]|uniref:Glycosyltransferase involved in cell wall biosynthesis n=1 Tax=Nocardiopsis algeriensis TaxID=1478215 RepID=A0A841ITA4_9ACTN|nr:glycosyltransferase [Nocardiopsis algeriensis]MBB6121893.1 glycosyltransferase involved in cell wall biosynthesis [Nocardiopsis algeriensis]